MLQKFANVVVRFLTGAATTEEYIERFLMPVYHQMIELGATENEADMLISKAIKESDPVYGKYPRATALTYVDCLQAGLSAKEILEG